MDDDDLLSYNFWPSFADLMLALTLVLVITLLSFIVSLAQNNYNLSEVKEKQEVFYQKLVDKFAGYTVIEGKIGEGQTADKDYDICIVNDAKIQHITFNENILFESGKSELRESAMVEKFRSVLQENLPMIEEIQIQGHTDSDRVKKGKNGKIETNIELAAQRAISVYNYLVGEDKISPYSTVISITSFGEYMPVKRVRNQPYSKAELDEHNMESYKDKNRRIEILLFYK